MIFGVLRGRRTGVADTNADGGVGCRSASSAGGETAGVEGGAASLSRALLSLSSLAAQQRALHYILQALQIQLCRDAVVAAFSNVSIELLLFFFLLKNSIRLEGTVFFSSGRRRPARGGGTAGVSVADGVGVGVVLGGGGVGRHADALRPTGAGQTQGDRRPVGAAETQRRPPRRRRPHARHPHRRPYRCVLFVCLFF